MEVILSNVRISFPDLFEARQFEAGKGPLKYRASFLIEPNSANHKTLMKAIQEVAKEEWKDKAPAILKAASEDSKLRLLVNGDSKEYDGYAGMIAVSATRDATKGRPLVIDKDKSPLTQTDGRPYGGCYVNAKIDLWAQNNKWGKCIRASLLAVQFAKDGDAFGAGTATADPDEFEDLSDTGAGGDKDDMSDLVA